MVSRPLLLRRRTRHPRRRTRRLSALLLLILTISLFIITSTADPSPSSLNPRQLAFTYQGGNSGYFRGWRLLCEALLNAYRRHPDLDEVRAYDFLDDWNYQSLSGLHRFAMDVRVGEPTVGQGPGDDPALRSVFRPSVVHVLHHWTFPTTHLTKDLFPGATWVVDVTDDPHHFDINLHFAARGRFDVLLTAQRPLIPFYETLLPHRPLVRYSMNTNFPDETSYYAPAGPAADAYVAASGRPYPMVTTIGYRGFAPQLAAELGGGDQGFWITGTACCEAHHELMKQARIVFAQSRYSDINRRTFEAALAGALVMALRLPPAVRLEGDHFTDGVDAVLYDNATDAAAKLRYYSDPRNEAQRAAIAKAGLERIRAEQTPRHGVDLVLSLAAEAAAARRQRRLEKDKNAVQEEVVKEEEEQQQEEEEQDHNRATRGSKLQLEFHHPVFGIEPDGVVLTIGDSSKLNHVAFAAFACAALPLDRRPPRCMEVIQREVSSRLGCKDEWCKPDQPEEHLAYVTPAVLNATTIDPPTVTVYPGLAIFAVSAPCDSSAAGGASGGGRGGSCSTAVQQACNSQGLGPRQCGDLLAQFQARCRRLLRYKEDLAAFDAALAEDAADGGDTVRRSPEKPVMPPFGGARVTGSIDSLPRSSAAAAMGGGGGGAAAADNGLMMTMPVVLRRQVVPIGTKINAMKTAVLQFDGTPESVDRFCDEHEVFAESCSALATHAREQYARVA